jgi:uncharacterized protein (TIGR03083 family)
VDITLQEMGRPTLRAQRSPAHEAYREIRRNIAELLADADDPNPDIPACPEWTLRDLIAHLTGSAALAIGRMSGWPAAHPSSSDMAVPELLRAWDQIGGEVELLLSERNGRAGNLLVTDAFTHELDIRYALNAPLPQAHPAFAIAFEVLANGFAASVETHHLPALRLATDETQWTVGVGEPAATVTGDRFDLYRSLTGRRTHGQITAMHWDRGSHRWLPAFTWGPFTPPESPVEPAA